MAPPWLGTDTSTPGDLAGGAVELCALKVAMQPPLLTSEELLTYLGRLQEDAFWGD